MTKKGQKGTYHKPKPRLAVYGGATGSGLVAAGVGPLARNAAMPYDLSVKAARSGGNLAKNVTNAVTTGQGAFWTAVPAVAGVAVSIGADKLGINKALAKAKAPFRI